MMYSAVISADEKYRYNLRRYWGPDNGPTPESMLFIMLNPSTADMANDDPTIRKCVGFAKLHGFLAIEVVNLWAFRATDPDVLREAWSTHVDVVGPENAYYITQAVERAGRIIVAWGASILDCDFTGRVADVRSILAYKKRKAHCFGRTSKGHPRHPLMQAYATPMEVWV